MARSDRTARTVDDLAAPLPVDLDMVIALLPRTLFSPVLCLVISLAVVLRIKEVSHPAFIATSAWTGLVCLIGFWNYLDRVYTYGISALFRKQSLKWDEQIVLITGGGSGIGALLAEKLVRRGVKVVVLSKDGSGNTPAQDNLHYYSCDVSDYKQVQAAAEQVKQEVGDPTIIVNNAGVVKGKLLLDLTEEDIKDTFGSNTLAHFWILKALLPALLRTGKGHIVTVSSIMGLVASAQMTDYCASKAALVNLHQSLRYELDNRYNTPSIRTTLLLPSFISTNLFSSIRLPSSTLFRFLAPQLQPQQVVDAIVAALEADESRVIRLPWYTNAGRVWGPGVGLVPRWLIDGVQWFTGADHAMRQYGPHPDAAQRLHAEFASKKAE